MSAASSAVASPRLLYIGRSFVHPAFDLFVIGGLLTLPIALFVTSAAGSATAFIGLTLPVILLVCNNAHFAASTVRLYTKPHSYEDFPFLTMGLPLLTFVTVGAFVMLADHIGHHLQALYLTWSPFHYAAQTFGLSTMYCYRSGCKLDRGEWWALRIVCLFPFLQSLLTGAPVGLGLGWIVPYHVIANDELTLGILRTALTTLNWLSFGGPILMFAWIAVRSRRRSIAGAAGASRPGLPLISLCLMLGNASWWVLFAYWDAQIWATILHGLQYLGIMAIFHSRDQVTRPGNRHGRGYHVVALLLMCTALGYALFQCWPRAYVLAGFGKVESMFMVIAAINIHHFIVDAYVWRIRKDRNYGTVVA
jgi:hypothetical protein